MSADQFTIKANDTLPDLVAHLYDPDDVRVRGDGTTYFAPIPLASVATFKFKMRPVGGGPAKVNADATHDEETELTTATYEWQTGDTDTPGLYIGEFEAVFTNGDRRSFPTDRYIAINIPAEVA